MNENIDFMKCKQAQADPAACLDRGQAVIKCVLNVAVKANKVANAELRDFRTCLKVTSNDFVKCRRLKREFENAYHGEGKK